ncbi:hypothetical protein SAY87_015294 [Trapa incisa]|uniref:Uncharacterized protein n=1 Tax=Trapa incisa TaxID=236973 RepID=A0AAN7GQK2_9MYRT|nr:hypothetical protein SAY87_015294 [Trapa incisa]
MENFALRFQLVRHISDGESPKPNGPDAEGWRGRTTELSLVKKDGSRSGSYHSLTIITTPNAPWGLYCLGLFHGVKRRKRLSTEARQSIPVGWKN